MPDLQDGETFEMKGSAAKPYILKNTGGVYSCTCPAWRNQSTPIERRTCKHLRKLRGDAAEEERIGGVLPQKPVKASAAEGDDAEAAGPPLLLAHAWDNAADLAGWWMSEKLDGVRAYWDGKQFLSRQGNLYHAPDWFIENLPSVPLDGELWIDRKKFQRTVSIVRRQDKSDLWKEVRYVVFDAPAAASGFEERIQFLADAFASAKSLPFAKLHDQQICRNLECLKAELARIEALGGEGLMLREPGSKYEVGRSSTLLKIKSFHDAEAIVIGHQDGAGKHKGRLGALLVKLPNGTEFAVGTGFSDKERTAPPPVGSTITFRYQELSEAGVPRFPSFVAIRSDVTVLQSRPSDTPTGAARAGETICISSSPAFRPMASTPPAASAAAPRATRRFEYTEGSSNKFWEISQSGRDVTTRWGRIGSAGQSKTKTFADDATAARQAERLIEEKTQEGYEEK